MRVVGICQIYNEVNNGNLERALDCYEKLCDEIVILDDASIINEDPKKIVFDRGHHFLKNSQNNWELQRETENKHFLLEKAKELGADWVFNFDADEILEPSFTRAKLQRVAYMVETNDFQVPDHMVPNRYSFGFHWRNLWLSKYWHRVDGGLGQRSPVRLYKVLPNAKIEVVQGLHKRLWPDYADNPTLLDFNLLHYSSSTMESLIGKIVNYCKLDERFPTVEERKQYYLYNLIKNVKVDACLPEWYYDDVTSADIGVEFGKDLGVLHQELIEKVEKELK